MPCRALLLRHLRALAVRLTGRQTCHATCTLSTAVPGLARRLSAFTGPGARYMQPQLRHGLFAVVQHMRHGSVYRADRWADQRRVHGFRGRLPTGRELKVPRCGRILQWRTLALYLVFGSRPQHPPPAALSRPAVHHHHSSYFQMTSPTPCGKSSRIKISLLKTCHEPLIVCASPGIPHSLPFA